MPAEIANRAIPPETEATKNIPEYRWSNYNEIFQIKITKIQI